MWHPWKIGEIQQLENVQRAFTRKITNVSHLHYWDRLKELGLMSLQRRRERFLIITMCKIMNNQCTNEVGIIFNNPLRLGITVQIPPLSKSSTARNQAIRDHSFSVIGSKLWNCIPSNITVQTNFKIFKADLTRYLLSLPDKKPVSGYTSVNSNSILDWRQGGQSTDDL